MYQVTFYIPSCLLVEFHSAFLLVDVAAAVVNVIAVAVLITVVDVVAAVVVVIIGVFFHRLRKPCGRADVEWRRV